MPNDTTPITPSGKGKTPTNSSDFDSSKDLENNSLGSANDDEVLKAKDFKYIALAVFMNENAGTTKAIIDFFTLCGIDRWTLVFGSGPASELLKTVSLPADSELKKPIFKQRLIQILDFVSSTEQEFGPPLTFADVSKKLKELAEQSASVASGHSTVTGTGTSSLRIKISVPKLTEFSGEPEEYYGWKRDTRNTFGAASMRAVVTDPNFHTTNPELSEAAFSQIAVALSKGTANYIVEDMSAANDLSAFRLVKKLDAAYNTETNKNNFIVSAVSKLVDLRLDHTTTVARFIEDYKQILLDLEDNGTKVAPLYPVLRAFLIRSVQSEEFKNEQSWIVDNPGKSLNDYLARLRLQDDNQRITDGRTLKADSGTPTSILRRSRYSDNQSDRGTKWKSDRAPWNIPPIPETWTKMMNKGAYRLICEWHSTCHNTHMRKDKCLSMFQVKAENPSGGSKRRRGGGDRDANRSRHARRGGRVDEPGDEETQDLPRHADEIRIVLNSPRLNRQGQQIPGSQRPITSIRQS